MLKLLALMFGSLLCCAHATEQSGAAAPVSYTVFIRGDVAGTERVEETVARDGALVSKSWHDLLVSDGLESKKLSFETELVLSKGKLTPVRYSYRYTSGESKDSCEVTAKGGHLHRTLIRAGRTSESSTPLEPDLVLLDFNVYHHYNFLLRRYDFKKGGRQTFTDYIPPLGRGIPLAVTPIEGSELDYGAGRIPVRNFKVEFVGVKTGVLSVDKEGRLVRLVIRELDLEVLRSDLVPDASAPQKP